MVYIHYSPNCLKLHDQYYHTYKENETNDDDDATPQENDDQAENETEWLDLSWPQITCSSDQKPNPETTISDFLLLRQSVFWFSSSKFCGKKKQDL